MAGAGVGYRDGTGSDAWFGLVRDVASDGTNLYVADSGNNRVRKVMPANPLPTGQQSPANSASPVTTGSVSTLAGSGSATTVAGSASTAGFNTPGGIAVVGGFAYVGSQDAISKVDLSSGQTTILAGSPPNPSPCSEADASSGPQAALCNVHDLTSDGHYVYAISGYFGSLLRRVALDTGATSTVARITDNGSDSSVHGVTVGPDGNLYATPAGKVLKINPLTGVVSTFFTFPTAESPLGLAADAQNLWVVTHTDPYQCSPACTRQIERISLTSPTSETALVSDDQLPDSEIGLEAAGGYLYIGTDDNTRRLRRYSTADGSFTTVAGAGVGYRDGTGSDAWFGLVRDVASDGTNLYVADSGNNRVRKVMAVPGATAPGGPVQPAETAGGGSAAELPSTCHQCVGRPVDTATGAEFDTTTDLAVPGRGPALALSRTYDSQLAGSNGRFGYGWTDSYAMSLAPDPYRGSTPLATSPVVVVTQENGARVTFARNGDGTYSAASRVLATLARNGDGTYTFTRRIRETFTFGASGRLTRQADLNGYATALAYNTGGQLATVTEPSGRQLTFSYGADGHISGVSDPSRTVAYGYDTAGNLTSVTDARGGVSSFIYDGNHDLLTMTDQRGKVTTNTYDAAGRVLTQTDPMNRVTRFAYSQTSAPGSLSTTVTDPKGNVTVYRYANGLLASETKGSGTASAATWSFGYDPATDGLTSVTDPNGHTSHATYDGAGNRLTATDALSHITTYGYDGLGDLTSVTDPVGVTTAMTYDAAGNLLSTATPLAGTSSVRRTTLAYGDSAHPGDVTALTDPAGKVWRYAYNARGDLRQSTDPLGNITTATYNTIGQRISTVSARGNVTGGTPASFKTSYGYNNFGQLTSVTDPLGDVTSYGYDAVGNQTSVTDANNHVTRTAYDADNETTTVTRPDASTLGYGYDAAGNRIRQTDGAGRNSSYGYDPLNRPTSVTDPLGRTRSLGYDAAGNQVRRTDAAGHPSTLGYDAANRLTSINYPDPATPDVSFGYDAAGRRTSMTDGSGTSTYPYDSLGRLTIATDGAGTTVGYGYNLAGALTALTYPGTTGTVTRGFDDAGRLTSVTDWASHTSTFRYDPDGNLTSVGYPNGIATAVAYDNADRLTSMGHARAGTTLASFGYTRSSAGLLTGTTTTGTPQGTESYGYTALSQLNAVNTGTYGYDAADNLARLPSGASLGHDVANQLTTLTPASGPATTFGFDSRGDRTSAAVTGGATTSYGYDAANRLVSLSGPAVPTPASYAYNGDGLRVAKTVGAATTRFSWDLAGRIPLLLADGINSYLYGPGGVPLEQVSTTGTTTYLQDDALGSVRLLTDATGAVVGTRAFDPYGSPSGSTGTATSPLGYAGEYTDAESGLVYLRARFYDPATGSFLTRDPLAADTQLPYGYVDDNPLNGSDPMGLDWLDNLSNWTAGFGDTVTFGGTKQIRRLINYGLNGDKSDVVDSCSVFYQWGGTGGLIASLGLGAEGAAAAGRVASSRLVAMDWAEETGAVGRGVGDLKFAGKVGLDVNSPAVVNRSMTVQDFISQFLKGSVLREFPGEYLGQTVEQALRSANPTVRKLLTGGDYVK